jgi:hypothetical protein
MAPVSVDTAHGAKLPPTHMAFLGQKGEAITGEASSRLRQLRGVPWVESPPEKELTECAKPSWSSCYVS